MEVKTRMRKPLMKGLTFFGKNRAAGRKESVDDSDIVHETALHHSFASTTDDASPSLDQVAKSPNKTFTIRNPVSNPVLPELLTGSREESVDAHQPSNLSYGSVDSDIDMSVTSHGSSSRGCVILHNGDEYEGAVKDGVMHGLGVLHHANGRVYKGDFVNSMKHGVGITIFPNGDKHIGLYSNSLMSGRGTYIFATGQRYVGEWSMDKFHGVGTVTYANGEMFYGEFFNGTKTSGSFIFPSGDVSPYTPQSSWSASPQASGSA